MCLTPVRRLKPPSAAFTLPELSLLDDQCREVFVSECDQARWLNDVTEVSGGSYLLTISEKTASRDESISNRS